MDLLDRLERHYKMPELKHSLHPSGLPHSTLMNQQDLDKSDEASES